MHSSHWLILLGKYCLGTKKCLAKSTLLQASVLQSENGEKRMHKAPVVVGCILKANELACNLAADTGSVRFRLPEYSSGLEFNNADVNNLV